MGDQSAISWTTATWNPWRGCEKVSPGCAHCYMFTEQKRYGRDPSNVTRCSPSTFYAPVRSKKWHDLPAGSLVFTCSWSDFFHADADEWRDEAWEVIRQRPDLTWQILTKRPERIAGNLPWWRNPYGPPIEPPHNVWLGVSIENRRFVRRADLLRQVPAAVRFISAEPLLGPLVIPGFPVTPADLDRRRAGWVPLWEDGYQGQVLDLAGIDWLIVGGESGPHHRPMRIEWVRDLHNACRMSGTAWFAKQDSGPRAGQQGGIPDDLWVHEWPAGQGR